MHPGNNRRDGREGLHPLGRLAIDQTSRAVKCVRAMRNGYNITSVIANLATKSKYRPRATARDVRVTSITKNSVTALKYHLSEGGRTDIDIRTRHE